MNDEAHGVILRLARLLVKTLWAGKEWASDVFVRYCEFVIRATVRTGLALLAAVLLYKLAVRFEINALLILAILVGGTGLLYFAIASSPARIGAEWLGKLSDTARLEIEKLSKFVMTMTVVITYCIIDAPVRYPAFLAVFLGFLSILYVASVLPGKSGFVDFCHRRYQWLVLVPLVLMTALSMAPEAVINRILNSRGVQRATGTEAHEIPYHLNDQDEVVDETTGQAMELFDRIADKNSARPRPLKGWVQDGKGRYRLYTWFDGQDNYTPAGTPIRPVTLNIVDAIVNQAHRAASQKLQDKAAAEVIQRAATDAKQKAAEDDRQKKLLADREKEQRDQQKERDSVLARRRTEIEAQQRRYVAVSSSSPQRAALVVAAGRQESTLTDRIARTIGTSSRLLSNAFVADGVFKDVLGGNYARLRAAEMEQIVSLLVLADVRSTSSSSVVAGESVFKGDAQVDVVVVHPMNGYSSDSFSTQGSGVGLSAQQAERVAIDRAIDVAVPRLATYR